MHRTHTGRRPRRGNDVHDVLSLITRLASAAAARAQLSADLLRRAVLSRRVRVSRTGLGSLFTSNRVWGKRCSVHRICAIGRVRSYRSSELRTMSNVSRTLVRAKTFRVDL
ncbi:unnamed protein product [Plutella xylostella]|uniref:(diamondback moth) hypothetical protein n=1 Tax=Plutella xylostella TaxID=51655 RepID=A0A8S4GA56_PLUXY|nr:unnamed protein product [Plutella xylostella]